MKSLVVLGSLILSTLSFAKTASVTTSAQSSKADPTSVSVIIDGKTYSCSEGGTSGSACADKASAISSKFNACKPVYNASYCFSSVIEGKVDLSCAEGTKLCNETCVPAYNPSYCYSKCY